MKPLNTIKLTMIKLTAIKLTSLAIALAFSGAAIAVAEDNATGSNDWQSSLAQEFTKLDASGNGLLLPAEASKGKAFNKKSFAAADADNDGTIDQAEYISHRTSKGAANQPGVASTSTASTSSNSMSTDNTSTAPDSSATNADVAGNTPDKTAEMSQTNTETKRPVGVIVDDSLITTKAKAAIFGTPDLKTLQISVETRQGEVTLTGMVDSAAAKMKAEEVVKSIEGVNSVTNNLEVKG